MFKLPKYEVSKYLLVVTDASGGQQINKNMTDMF